MARKVQNLFEIFFDYDKENVMAAINSLKEEDIKILKMRFGSDLDNPIINEEWDSSYNAKLSYIKGKIKTYLECVKTEATIVDSEKICTKVTPSSEVVFSGLRTGIDSTSRMLLELLKTPKSPEEICKELCCNREEYYQRLISLKSLGSEINRKFYADGRVLYSAANNLSSFSLARRWGDTSIITDSNLDKLRVLVLSDLHFGNDLAKEELLNRAFEYCSKNGIHTIFCCGDFIDGNFTKGSQSLANPIDQFEKFIKDYPHDDHIITYGVGGDHDLSLLYSSNINFCEALKNSRDDIIVDSFGYVDILLKNDRVRLYHKIEGLKPSKDDFTPIMLHGHSHQYRTYLENGVLNANVPSLSGILQPMPTVLDMELEFKNGFIYNTVLSQIYFADNCDVKLGESVHEFDEKKSIGKINYVENFPVLGKNISTNAYPGHMSQIEKFNRRYGK